MGLIRGLGRTAAVAGTATAVANRVSRRQQSTWAAKNQAAEPPPAGAAPAPPAAAPAGDDLAAQLDRLSIMRDRGQLTEAEYTAAKAKLLGT